MSAEAITGLISNIGSAVSSNLLSLLYAGITMFSFYFLLEEENEVGWKRFIPIYGDYVCFKTFYKKSKFFLFAIAIIIFVLSIIIMAGVGAYIEQFNGGIMSDDLAVIFAISAILFLISLIIILIISIGFDISISHKYEKKGLFTFGMIFMTPLFLFALAWENRKKIA